MIHHHDAHETSHAQPPSAVLLALLAVAQMLPATMLSPAIRPLFAALHPGRDGALHAFFALNMVGGAIAAPLSLTLLRRGVPPRTLLTALALADALLIASFAGLSSESALLVARTLEGACHVATSTVLLAVAASPTRTRSAVPAVGAGIMAAVALGSVLGALLVGRSLVAPFAVAAALLAAFALGAHTVLGGRAVSLRAASSARFDAASRSLAATGLVARFQVGVLVVSFALLAHRAHGMSDRQIGVHLALVTVPFALATWPLTRVAERRACQGILATGLVVMGASTVGLGWLPTSALGADMIGMGLGSAAVFAGLLARASRGGDALDRARRMAILNSAGCVGMLLGPTVAGILSAVARSAADPARGQRVSLLVAGIVALGWGVIQGVAAMVGPAHGASEFARDALGAES